MGPSRLDPQPLAVCPVGRGTAPTWHGALQATYTRVDHQPTWALVGSLGMQTGRLRGAATRPFLSHLPLLREASSRQQPICLSGSHELGDLPPPTGVVPGPSGTRLSCHHLAPFAVVLWDQGHWRLHPADLAFAVYVSSKPELVSSPAKSIGWLHRSPDGPLLLSEPQFPTWRESICSSVTCINPSQHDLRWHSQAQHEGPRITQRQHHLLSICFPAF